MFSKFGHVNKLDFLFHKVGPLKGKPRGYAFIEYASDDVRLFPCRLDKEKVVVLLMLGYDPFLLHIRIDLLLLFCAKSVNGIVSRSFLLFSVRMLGRP